MEAMMTNDGTDTPAEQRPAQPGWGERLALWAMVAIFAMIGSLFLRLALQPIVGEGPAHAVSRGLCLAVFIQLGRGDRSIRAFLETSAVCMAAAAAAEWWGG
jgi:ABC-type Mn2+/Zn2+ transport system permease subunit